MSDNRQYYRVIPDTPAMTRLQEFLDEMKKATEARKELMRSFEACGVYGGSFGLKGLFFGCEGAIPEKWKAKPELNHKGKIYAQPHGNSRKAVEDRHRLSMSKALDFQELTEMMTGSMTQFWDGGRMRQDYMGWRRFGDVHIVDVPSDTEEALTGEDPWEPMEGLEEMKTSEFYQLKEEHEHSKEGADRLASVDT